MVFFLLGEVMSDSISAILALLHDIKRGQDELRDQLGLTPRQIPADHSAIIQLDEQLVTLDQAAAMVKRSKRSLERYRDVMPAPCVRGTRGQANLWRWREIRPWLQSTFGFLLPERFPGSYSDETHSNKGMQVNDRTNHNRTSYNAAW